MFRLSHASSFIGLVATLGVCACGSDDASGEFQIDESIQDVVFLDGTTDEALLNLLSRDAVDEDSKQVMLTEPTDDTLSADTVPAFEWTYAESASVDRSSSPPVDGRSNTSPRQLLEKVTRFLSPISVAHAHGTPFNGTAYFLEFSADEDSEPLLRVFVGRPSYPMAEDRWDALATESNLSLSVLSADFDNNLLVTDGGPFLGGRFNFTVD